MIRIDEIWLATEPLDMRAGADTALARVVRVFGSATYVARAFEKLRAQGSLCKKVRISIRPGMFNPDEAKFAKGIICELPYPTDDTRLVIQAAQSGLDAVFQEGYAYAKAEILLLDLRQRGEFTDDLFAHLRYALSGAGQHGLPSKGSKPSMQEHQLGG